MIPNPETLKQMLIRDIENNVLLARTANINSHLKRHIDTTKTETLNRILSEGITTNSMFTDTDNINTYIADTLLYNIQKIYDWVEYGESGREFFTYTHINHDKQSDPIGIGYMYNTRNNTIKEFTTNDITVVLEYNKNNTYEFDIITVYPDITKESKSRMATNRSIAPILRKTEAYQQASPIQMNDRYLYRAKRTDNGEWVTGTPLFYQDGSMTIYGQKQAQTVGFHIQNNGYCDRNTLCQCTGLKDKNGKLIWENDIIKCKCGIAVVVWDKSEWRIKWVKDTIWRKDLHFWVNDENESGVEVIGSAIDNPELLEVEE